MQPKRSVNHHAYVNQPYAAICDRLERDGHAIVAEATQAAAIFAADLAGYLEQRLGFFDREERVQVVTGPLERTGKGSTMSLRWEADPTKRVLPNVEAVLELNPLISVGRSATSELGLRGTYAPPRERHRSLVEQMLARRLVDATLHTFLRHLADALGTGDDVGKSKQTTAADTP